MTFERGREVYVFFEGVFALDLSVDTDTSSWVTVRTSSGSRVHLPIEAVADWDVESPLGSPVASQRLLESLPPSGSTRGQVSTSSARRLRRV